MKYGNMAILHFKCTGDSRQYQNVRDKFVTLVANAYAG